MAQDKTAQDKTAHRTYAAQFFNAVWDLLDRKDRSPADDLQMIHLAHASRAHWQFAGGPREWAIGEWQIARVHAVLGRAEGALTHAKMALTLAETHDLGPFMVACGVESMARALSVAGLPEQAAAQRVRALALCDQIADAEERDIVLLDLNNGR